MLMSLPVAMSQVPTAKNTAGTAAALRRLETIKDLVVKQTTPVRVLHRRTAMIRDKIVHSMATEPINEHWFVLRLVTSAGTYVKEFVHGDLGRTEPNVGSLLGCNADIIQLDVLGMVFSAADDETAEALTPATPQPSKRQS